MKIICDCGNECELLPPSYGEERIIDEEKGLYVTKDITKFNFLSGHDEVGIVCYKCKKSIWLFT